MANVNLYHAYFALVIAVVGLAFAPSVAKAAVEIFEPYVPATLVGKLCAVAGIAGFMFGLTL